MVKSSVIALGGNAITREGEDGSITTQFRNTRTCLESVVKLIELGRNIVFVHGNGPQIGADLRRVEEARNVVPTIPLGVLVADSQGGMGYMIAQTLKNKLLERKIEKDVCTIITQVLCDENDPSLQNPTKFIGEFLTKQEAYEAENFKGWIVKEDPGRGYRRVVPSPKPLKIIESRVIELLIKNDVMVIAGGGGGIPVYYDANGKLEGIDGVVDKDLTASLLASQINAQELIFLTGVNKLFLNFRQENQKQLDVVTLSEAKKYLALGHFPKGSMGPKIEAAIKFLENGGERAIISSVENVKDGVFKDAGTKIIRD
ncbi:carbamate kinase [bacterium]|nr:carbamate kinase [bacterium]